MDASVSVAFKACKPYFCSIVFLIISKKALGQKKLIRFNEIKTFQNVWEYPKDMRGRWQHYFNNKNPVTLELACGKGEYTLGLARLHPESNFIGMDIKGNRIWRGAKTALEENLHNVAFIRSHIDKITDYFEPEEVQTVWITFPDPQLRTGKMKKRLTHPRFLRLYQQIVQPESVIHLKTDSPDLHQFTKAVCDLYELPVLTDEADLYSKTDVAEDLKIKTHYEGLNISGSGRIYYLQFQINKPLPTEKDRILKQMFPSGIEDAAGEN